MTVSSKQVGAAIPRDTSLFFGAQERLREPGGSRAEVVRGSGFL
jgi:hypothetical protein